MWRVVSMSELWDFLNPTPNKATIKPTFPTRRWGDVTTAISTTDKVALNRAILMYSEIGIKARKRKDKENMKKFKNLGVLYTLEIWIKEEEIG